LNQLVAVMFRIVVCLSLMLSAQLSFADAEADIKYRKAVMKVVGGHMAGMGTILRNGVHPDDLAFHARGMANVAALVPNVFPAGSGEGKTEALPAIWEDEAAFKVAMDKFVTAANATGAAADTGDNQAIAATLKALGGSCKGCHDDYKAD
jgi:cytochrome c556